MAHSKPGRNALRVTSRLKPASLEQRRKGSQSRQRFRQLLIESLEDRRLMARVVSGTLASSDSWSGTIHVTNDLVVPNGVTLDIAPGTVIKFDTGKFLKANAGSTLNAQGTLNSQVFFTSSHDDTIGEDLTPGVQGAPIRGHWESIYLETNTAQLDYVNVRYAGNSVSPENPYQPYRVPSIEIAVGTTPTLKHVAISDGDWTGIDVQGNASLDTITIQRTRGVAITQGLSLSPTYRNLSATNTGGNHVLVAGGQLLTSQSWAFGGLPAHLSNDLTIGTNGVLDLAPGTIIKVSEGRSIHAQAGALKALGTLAQPIIFTSNRDDLVGGDSNADGTATLGGPGQWEALYVDNSATQLQNVEVRYAGNVLNAGNSYEPYRVPALQIRSAAAPTFTNVRVRFAENIGVSIIDTAAPRLESLSVENSGREAIYQTLAAVPVYVNLNLTGNVANRLTVQPGTLSVDRTFDFNGHTIYFGGDLSVDQNVSLTLVPGSVVKFGQGAYFNAIGTLVAVGDSDKPIIFTSIQDDTVGGDSNGDGTATVGGPGQWESL